MICNYEYLSAVMCGNLPHVLTERIQPTQSPGMFLALTRLPDDLEAYPTGICQPGCSIPLILRKADAERANQGKYSTLHIIWSESPVLLFLIGILFPAPLSLCRRFASLSVHVVPCQ